MKKRTILTFAILAMIATMTVSAASAGSGGDPPYEAEPSQPAEPSAPVDGDHGTIEAAATFDVIFNGSFEAGLAGWETKEIELPFVPLGVVPGGVSPGFGLFETEPTDGTLVFEHGFDGGRFDGSPDTIEIWQDVSLPPGSLATLIFDWRIGFDYTVILPFLPTLDRSLDLVIEPAGGGAPLATFNLITTDFATTPTLLDNGGVTELFDMSAFAGEDIRVKWVATIPEFFTGPGHFQLDFVELFVTTTESEWFFSNSVRGGPADFSTIFGPGTGDDFYVGDWDGDGRDDIARRLAGTHDFELLDIDLVATAGTRTVSYGVPGDEVFVGDWDGDGFDTLAVRRGNVFLLRNSISPGPAFQLVGYGLPTDEVFVGDWDGDGIDTFAVRRGNVFLLRNSNTSGPAHQVIGYGTAGDPVVVGDWDGDGIDTLAVRRGRMLHVRRTLTSGPADFAFTYGFETDEIFAGDWDIDGRDSVVARREVLTP